MKQAFPNAENWVDMLFSDIENAVLDGDVDLGLIIHENRFTYEGKGLKKIIDLGEYWEKTSGHPIPCLLYTSPSPRDRTRSRMPSSA